MDRVEVGCPKARRLERSQLDRYVRRSEGEGLVANAASEVISSLEFHALSSTDPEVSRPRMPGANRAIVRAPVRSDRHIERTS